MISLELTTEEKDLLVEVLENYISDLRMEVADTDSPFFKEQLKARKEKLMKILNALTTHQESQ